MFAVKIRLAAASLAVPMILLGGGQLTTSGERSGTWTVAARVDGKGEIERRTSLMKSLPVEIISTPASSELTAYSPNGEHIAYLTDAGKDEVILHLRYRKRQKDLWNIKLTSSRLYRSLVFSPDGKYLAAYTVAGKIPLVKILVWDVSSGKETCQSKPRLFDLRPYSPTIFFSPDSKFLFVAEEYGCPLISSANTPDLQPQLYVWNAADGSELVRDKECGAPLALTSDGKTLATLQSRSKSLNDWEHSIQFWDWRTSMKTKDVAIGKHPMRLIAFSDDDKSFITVDAAGAVKIWETATLRVRRLLRTELQGVESASFSRKNQILTMKGDDGKIVRWNMKEKSRE